MNETILLLISVKFFYFQIDKNSFWSFKLSKWIATNLNFIGSLSLLVAITSKYNWFISNLKS